MNLTTAISNVLTGLQYAPFVSTAVQAVEVSNGALPGATKKQLVLAAVQAAAKVGEAVPEAHVALISALIDTIVTVLNAAGVFGKPPAVAIAPVLKAA
jgi:hypothetical protein